jgi:hypothetical protein
MGDAFDEHRDKLANFEDDLVDLCYDIVEASYDTENAYYKTFPDSIEGIYAAPKEYVANLDMPTPYDFDNDYFNHARYRQDVAQLVNGDLTMFLDEADPTQFDEAIERLGRASEHLELVVGYEGLSALGDVLAGWQGEAAYNFQHDVIPKVGVSVVYQLLMLQELVAVAKCLQEVVLRCRADGLALAQEMLDKVTLDEMKVDWEAVLWVAGSVAAGVATFAVLFPASVATVAGAAGVALSTASGAMGQVTRLSGSPAGERAITGATAYGFIPSAVDQVQNVLGKGIDEVESVMNALKGDLDSAEIDYLAVSKPKVVDGAEMNIVNAENSGEGYLIESIADLRFAGAVTLPVMAEYFDKAYGEVANLTYPFANGIGKSHVATTPSMRHLPTAIEVLADAFKDSRDYLYRAGVALTDIADTYFDHEEQQQAVMDNFTAQLAEFDTAAFERYAPGSRSPSTDR